MNVNNNPQLEMWAWDGQTWTQQFPTIIPVGLGGFPSGFNLGYDVAHNQLLVDVNATFICCYANEFETWASSGLGWTRVASYPNAASGMKAYDAARTQEVMVGCALCYGGVDLNTWLWDGTAWTQPANSMTFSSSYISRVLAYDQALGQTLLLYWVGGALQTWGWNGSKWNQLVLSTNPTPTMTAVGMAYDSVRGEMVLLGSSSSGYETWVLK